jgi:lipopolysaccharide export system permease protein
MMRIPKTLSRYLVTTFTLNLFGMAAMLLGLIYLLDMVELLRRAAKFNNVPLSLVIEMGFLKLPEIGQTLFPFIILFSALFTFWQLSRRQELVVLRSAGISVWQFLAPFAAVAAVAGLLVAFIVNPLGAIFYGKFRSLESNYLDSEHSTVALFDEGLWLRQETGNGYAMLHADKVEMPNWKLQQVMTLFFDKQDVLTKRIDAEAAQLKAGEWEFREVVENPVNQHSIHHDILALPTHLTTREIEDSFATPETMGFWNLPSFIQTLDRTGFDSTRLRIHFQALLSQPFLYMSMILLAAAVAMRPQRQGGTFLFIIGGVFIGFFMFFMTSFLQAMGSSHQIPIFLAAWSPALLGSLLGIATLLTLEDG